MKHIKFTSEHITKAKELSDEMGKLKNSITKGDGNLAGFIGELLVSEYLGSSLCNTYDYDLIHKGIKIDVKTTRTTVTPLSSYECSIPAYNTKQGCDVYCFVRINMESKDAWILGYKNKQEYFDMATYRKKGQRREDGWLVKATCYTNLIKDLDNIDKLAV